MTEKERLMLAIGKQKKGRFDIGIILRKVGQNMFMRRGYMRFFTDLQITSSTRRSTFYLVSPHGGNCYNHVLKTSRSHEILIPMNGSGNFYVQSPAPEYAWDCEDRLFFNNPHWGGSDWRAIEVIDNAEGPTDNRRFIALFSLEDATPQCYIMRWRKELAVMFDRRHQSETTRLDEFRDVVNEATNEVQIEETGAKLSIQLVPTTIDEHSGTQFRVELQKAPQFSLGLSASVAPTTARTSLFDPHHFSNEFPNRDDSCQNSGHLTQVESPVFHGSRESIAPETCDTRRVVSTFQCTSVLFPESDSSDERVVLGGRSTLFNDNVIKLPVHDDAYEFSDFFLASNEGSKKSVWFTMEIPNGHKHGLI